MSKRQWRCGGLILLMSALTAISTASTTINYLHPSHFGQARQILCPKVNNIKLSTDEKVQYNGYQWKVKLYSFDESEIKSINHSCVKLNLKKSKYHTIKESNSITSLISLNPAMQIKSNLLQSKKQCKPGKPVEKNAILGLDSKTQARSVNVNTVTDMTYGCYVPLINDTKIVCQGYVKPRIHDGQQLTEKQILTEVHYKFILDKDKGVNCDCQKQKFVCRAN